MKPSDVEDEWDPAVMDSGMHQIEDLVETLLGFVAENERWY